VIDDAARWIAISFGLWLIAVGALMIVRPGTALRALQRFGTTAVIHYGELTVRTIVGAALVLAAPASHHPPVLEACGWFLVVTSLLIGVLPRTWHAQYSGWWAERIPSLAVRLLAPTAALGGGALVWELALPR
jgi:hypothetical protein